MKLLTKKNLLIMLPFIGIMSYQAFQLIPKASQEQPLETTYSQLVADHETAAAKGNKDSQTFLGLAYLHGQCVKEDQKKSLHYFKLAAENGDANGQNNLAVTYLTESNNIQNAEKALTWLKKSAEQGWSEAQFNLGICYSLGIGIPKDINIAKDWFQKAQQRGIHSKHDPRIEEKALLFLEGKSPFPDKNTWIRNWAAIGF